MISGRAKAVSKSSIKALYSVCHRSTYSNSIKVAPLRKNLSTASGAFPRYQTQVENDSEPESRNQDWVGGGDRNFDSVQASKGLGNKVNINLEGYGGSGGFESQRLDRNIGGISSGNGVAEYGQEWDGYRWSNAKELGRNSGERVGNFDGANRQSGALNIRGGNGNVEQFSGNVGGLRSENGGAYQRDGASVTDYQTSVHHVASGNSGPVSSFGQYQPAASNYGKQQPASSNYGQHQPASSNYGQHQPASSNSGQYQPASSNYAQHQPASNNYGQHQPASSNYGQHQPASSNYGQHQPASSNYGQHQPASSNYGQHQPASNNYGQYQPSNNNNSAVSSFGQNQWADKNNYGMSNFSQNQSVINNNYALDNHGQYQRVDNSNYAPNVGAFQQTATQQIGNVGLPTGHHYQYRGSSATGYQQNPYGNLIYRKNTGTAPLVSNSTGPYPSDVSQVPGNSNMYGNSSDALETPQIRGTIEELEEYAKEGKLKEALEVLELLEKNQQRLIPERDMPTMVTLMEACSEAKADKEAKVVHQAMEKLMSPLPLTAYNKILDMYLKCGSTEEAYSLFNEIPTVDQTTWDTMIKGLVNNDLGEEAINIFTEFKNTELKPDGQMFLAVFSACGIVGDVTEGMLHFKSMSKQYGITPSMEHYVGVVEMLGHAGYLDTALEFVEDMPINPSVDVWEMLMHVSRIQGNVELGDHCAELVEKLDPSRLSEQSKAGLIPLTASDLEKDKEKKKLASKNLLEVRSRVHEYRAGDTSHPENDRIYALLRGLKTQMKEAGYIPELRGVLHDIDPEGKEEALLAHSERLAAAYGFLTTAARQPIRVIKNLRVCVDCHNALKIISKLVGRELIMRDAKRFHHFKDGVCSCKDYW